MGFGAKFQQVLRCLPSLFDSDTGKHDPQFQLVRRDDVITGQVRRTVPSISAVNTPLPNAFPVARSNVVLPTTRDYHGPKLLAMAPHHDYYASPLVSTSPLEVSVNMHESYGSNELREYLASIGSGLLPRSTGTSNVSIPGLFNKCDTDFVTGTKAESFSQWLPQADSYIAELIRSEGRGETTNGRCSRCLDSLYDGLGIHCEDCYDQGLYCVNCCIFIHSCHPFHRIKVCTTKQR